MNIITVDTANAERIAYEVLADVIKPPEKVDYLAWAENNIVFSELESPDYPGPYNRRLFRYFDAVLQALSPDDLCRIVSLMKSAQIGGTVAANIFTGGSMDMDPSWFLYVHPTENNAERWSKMKLAPMLRNTTSLTSLFPKKSRDGLDSLLYKERADGRGAIQISGANSAASLSQVTMKRQVQDDLSKWETNTGGDPETQADSRSRGVEEAKIFKISTPLVMPGCRITKNFEDGSQEYPYVPCPHCGHYQVLEWENMLANLDEAHPEKAHFTCIECGTEIEEYHRQTMLDGLQFRPHNPSQMRFHRSFYIWSAYSPLQSWERIAREWLSARGDPASEQTFLNDTVGKAYVTLGEAPPWEALRDRGAASDYPRGKIPVGGIIVTIGIDCQGDRVEWQLVVWGRDFRRWVVDCGVIPGHITEKSCQERLDALVAQTWTNSYGQKLAADKIAIDGNAYTEDVWLWAKRHPASRVVMVRGAKSESAPLTQRVKKERNHKTGKILNYSKRFYNFNGSILKMALYRNVAKLDPMERGFVGFPTGLEDEYYRQLTAERRVPKKKKDGFVEYVWEKDPAQANEMLDTMNQAEVAAILFGVRGMPDKIWDRLESEREVHPPEAQFDFEDGLFSALKTAVAVIKATAAPPVPAEPKKPPRTNRWAKRK
ncbi:phage terminase large subunit family protein [Rhizobium sp. CFBP 8762]|uniref:phage terminase large subunit family protein n=1 Tax=Rhizobium sp. CFBP 8762 TaxID=2775279 RepID=UPI001783AD9E|nr:terminase gpA endonuclease subunit [Rhizobium sp. CFBP 8762]MBD8556896.1 phage terminase large subunit family protein [Rhizobium sp. CFBP 8762]